MIKRRKKWRSLVTILSLIVLYLSSVPTAKAESPFETFSVNGFGQTIFTQPAYEPKDVLAQDIYIKNEEGESVYSPLKQPNDLFIDHNDEIYIADTGNNRIVQLDRMGELIRILEVPDSPLNQPSGIFVTENDEIYIADTGNKRVIQLDKNGDLTQEYVRPESKYIDESFVYEPINMIVDSRGFVYVVSTGTFQGIIQFNPEGEFYGFYGTNITEVGIMDRVRNIFYTQEQLRRQVRLLPNPIVNISVDDNGYIYTVSNDKEQEIKKLNIRGENQWKEFSYKENVKLSMLKRNSTTSSGNAGISLSDVTINNNGIVTIVDKANSIIAQFDQEGEILFFWGAPNTSSSAQKGVLKSPVAVDTNSRNEIFILDDSLDLVQVLRPTEFGGAVQQALILTDQGEYNESEKYWEEVTRQNALFTSAYSGLARSAYYKEDYEQARELYKRAGDEVGYSDSFWQIRLEWFQDKFPIFANIFLILAVISLILIKVQEKRAKKRRADESVKPKKRVSDIDVKNTLGNQLKHVFYILRHPIDGFDDVRFRNMGGYISALIVLVVTMSVALGRIYLTSFTFHPVQPGSTNVMSIILMSVLVWISWVICHYLIGSIRQGQARFRDIFVGSAYSLFPVALLGLPLALLSNIMTLSESSIYIAIVYFMILWCAALMFWMIMTLQNYSVGETIVTILLTIFSMIILWVIILIIVGLSSETIEFLITVYREVTM